MDWNWESESPSGPQSSVDDDFTETNQQYLDQIKNIFLHVVKEAPVSQLVFESHKRKILRLVEERVVLVDGVIRSLQGKQMRKFSRIHFSIDDEIHSRLAALEDSIVFLVSAPPAPPEPHGCCTQNVRINIDCPSFSGEVGGDKFAYRNFIAKFKYKVEGVRSDQDKLVLLKSKLYGRAFSLVSGLGCSDQNYSEALRILQKHFFNENLVREELLERIAEFDCRGKHPDKIASSILEMSHQLKELDREFNYGFTTQSGGDILIGFFIFRKFPAWLREELMRRARSDFPTWNRIEHYVGDCVSSYLRRQPGLDKKLIPVPVTSTPKKTSRLNPDFSRLRINSSEFKSKSDRCVFCGKPNHPSESCYEFNSYEKRKERCLKKGYCVFCTSSRHPSENCPGKAGFSIFCQYCGGKSHLSVMCPLRSHKIKNMEHNICITTSLSEKETILPILRVGISWGG